jgi:hypothetical protein
MEMCTPRHPPLQPTTKHHRRDPCTAPHAAEGTQPRQAKTRCLATTTTRTPPPHRSGVATPASSSVFTAQPATHDDLQQATALATARPWQRPALGRSRSAPEQRPGQPSVPPAEARSSTLPPRSPAQPARRPSSHTGQHNQGRRPATSSAERAPAGQRTPAPFGREGPPPPQLEPAAAAGEGRGDTRRRWSLSPPGRQAWATRRLRR